MGWEHDTEPPPSPKQVSATVTKIVDGDTIELEIGKRRETVRLLGIDTPEKPGGPRPPECFGDQASTFMAALAPEGSKVWVSRDQETRDQYGRLLAWLYRDDGTMLNLAMVESGHATALFFAPNDDLEPLFTQAGWLARREQRGFWTECGAADVVLNPNSNSLTE